MNINSLKSITSGLNIRKCVAESKNIVRNATVAFGLATTPIATANHSVYNLPVRSIYEKSIPHMKQYMSDSQSFYLFDMARKAVQTDINTGLFQRALAVNKKNLMKDLKINKKTYDSYVELTKVIGQEERSIYSMGDPGCYSPFDIGDSFSEYGNGAKNFLSSKLSYTPIDMERFVVKEADFVESELFSKYGVDFSDEKITPEKRAIGTIIHLAKLEKEYPKYLKEMEKLRPDFKDKEVQKSINNAVKIMSDDILAPFAVSEMDAVAHDVSFIVGDIGNLNIELLSKKDINDLRIYARSIILSKDVYLVERWDNHPIIPAGENGDSAAANILSLLLNKTE